MSHPFASLTPDLVLDAVESLGYLSDARVLALNSYENRVYQVGLEGEAPLIAKFYRPQRWSDAAIREEHQFSAELAALDIPVVAPCNATAAASSSMRVSALRCSRGAADGHPSRAISTSCTALASCSAACMQWVPCAPSSTARH